MNQYQGLSSKEVLESRAKYGMNMMEKKKKESLFSKVLNVFKEPMFLLLLITASIYFILREVGDGIIMLCFILFISGIEFFQEQKTDKALEALNTLSALNVKVLRDGKIQEIDSKDIVMGDIILLEEGDKVSADGILLECQGLGMNESSLTGESEVVYKKIQEDNENHFKWNMCYAGTDVANGSALMKVVAIGSQTEYGKIGKALNAISKEKTPLEKQIKKLVIVCTIISFIFFIFVLIVNFMVHSDLQFNERLIQSILPAITVVMSSIPEEIPVVLTVFLAMGAWQLAKKNALTKNMKAVETLGAVTVLCTDKTGTLTENKMQVQNCFIKDDDFYRVALLACSKEPYDPMEIAIQDACFTHQISKEIYHHTCLHEYIFNHEDKMMGQVWQLEQNKILCVKGAYENVLPLCHLKQTEYDEIVKQAIEYSKKGYRVLALAKNDHMEQIPETLKENTLSFVGLIALVDPPRHGVKESIQSCYEAGVRVIMITGDNGDTAKGIASQIGLKQHTKVITGEELEKMSDEELEKKVKETNIFARVYPNHKMRIVKALQKHQEVVAMTGDGVNDAPALKRASIGIAMGKRGTNVSKEASDMILMDDHFNTIVDAIKNGRVIYSNIKKAISYILVIHMPIALACLFVPLLHLPVFLLPIHIVLLELIIDPTSSIIFERLKPDNNVMKEKPRKINDPIISSSIIVKCILQEVAIFAGFFGSYYHLIKNGMDPVFSVTFSFTVLVLSNIFIVYVLQSNEFALKNMIIDLKDKVIAFINFVIILMLLFIIYVPFLQKIVGTTPLTLKELFCAILISIMVTLPFDLLKLKEKSSD